MVTIQEAVQGAVAIVKTAGVPIYKPKTARKAMVPGVCVRLGWRKGTLDVLALGDNGEQCLDTAIKALAANGWRVVAGNPAALCYSMERV